MLILSAYSRKPVYYFDKELLNNQHNKTSNNGDEKASDIGYTGGVLSRENNSQDEADSYIDYDINNFGNKTAEDICYTGGGYHDYSSNGDEVYPVSPGRNDKKKAHSFVNLNKEYGADCEDIIESEVVPEYVNKLIVPDIDDDQVVVNVPVVLSQFELEFACETMIKLDYPAFDIKRVKKNIFLDECRLLPKVNKLFIGGIVRKNIEYSTEDNIRHATVEIPFKCTTEVQYFTPPVVNSNDDQIEVETLRTDGKGNDLTEKTYISSEHFNEKIYCKLVSDEIKELNISDEDKEESEHPECENFFEVITEKMVIKLNLKLIQEQQININR
jgi:hypothetical protein